MKPLQFAKHFSLRALAILVVNSVAFMPMIAGSPHFIIMNVVLWGLAVDYLIVGALCVLLAFVVEPYLGEGIKRILIARRSGDQSQVEKRAFNAAYFVVNAFLLAASVITLWANIWTSPNQGECHSSLSTAGWGEQGPNCTWNRHLLFDLWFRLREFTIVPRRPVVPAAILIPFSPEHCSVLPKFAHLQCISPYTLASFCSLWFLIRPHPYSRQVQNQPRHHVLQRPPQRAICATVRLHPTTAIWQSHHPLSSNTRSGTTARFPSQSILGIGQIILLRRKVSTFARLCLLHSIGLLLLSCLVLSKHNYPSSFERNPIKVQSAACLRQPVTLLLWWPPSIPSSHFGARPQVKLSSSTAGLGQERQRDRSRMGLCPML
jgi:hypothetical protein